MNREETHGQRRSLGLCEARRSCRGKEKVSWLLIKTTFAELVHPWNLKLEHTAQDGGMHFLSPWLSCCVGGGRRQVGWVGGIE